MSALDYAIARVRGLRSRLLARRALLQLIEQPASVARDLARGLTERLAHDGAALDRLFAPTRTGRILRAIADLDDAHNLKTILRGIEHREPPARLLPLVQPTPELDEGALKELCLQRKIKGVIDLLATWGSRYAEPLLAARSRELPALETALDRYLFERAVRAAERGGADGRIALAYLRVLIDLTNATTLLKVGPNAGPLFIPGPGGEALPLARYQRLAALATPDLHAALVADRALGLAPAFVDGAPHPVLLARLAQRRLRQTLRRASLEQPHSIAVPLTYLLDRREEARAIRLVVAGAELGMPSADVAVLIHAGGAA